MDRQQGDRPASRRRLLLMAALALCGATLVAVALTTGGLRLWKSESSAERAAQERCESDVQKQLASPATANLSDIHTETSSLDVDGRDMFPLTLDEPLKGIDTAHITVLNVSGVVNAQNAFGSTIRDHFDCRAYFVDGSLAHTLVVFDHAH